MERFVRVLIGTLAIGLSGFLSLASSPVAAHEHVFVGEYELIIGWREEPAVAGALNGLDLGILNGTKAPVLGAETALQAVLSSGTASVTKDLDPAFGRAGWYTFDVIPTRAGNYSVRLVGMLGTTPVDVVVGLDSVRPASAVAFPVADPTPGELQARLDTIQTLLVLTIVVALIGLAMGAFSLSRLLKRARGPEIPR